MTDIDYQEPGVLSEEQLREQHEALAANCLSALYGAADIISHVRAHAVPSDGRTEAGVDFRVERTPIVSDAADAADQAYSVLVSWCWALADMLGVDQRPPAPDAWRTGAARPGDVEQLLSRIAFDPETWPFEVAGFRAGTSPEHASVLVRPLARWLLDHHDRVRMYGGISDEYFADVVATLKALRGRWPMSGGGEHRGFKHRRACPICGQFEVVTVWYSDRISEISLRCEHCRADTDEIAAALHVSRGELARAFRSVDSDEDVRVEECADCGRRAPREPGVLIEHMPGCRFNPVTRRRNR